MWTNITQSKPWFVVIKWKTTFKRSVGELEIQNSWRRSLHLILDCSDKSNPSETVQLNKSTFEIFTRSEGCKAKFSTTVYTLDLKSHPTTKQQLWIVFYQLKQERKGFRFLNTHSNTKHITTSWKIHANRDKNWSGTQMESKSFPK